MGIRHFLSLFILAAAASLAMAADPAPAAKPAADSEPRTYIGDSLRIGAGYDSKTKWRGEYFQVLKEDAASALIGEAWISGSAGGLKLDYHWSATSDETAKASVVRKAFIALDQNQEYDRKLTIGGGAEYANWFWGAYLSGALTGRRLLSTTTTSTTQNVSGVENGRPYMQEVITATTTRLFERPYDYGVGATVGRFYEPSLLRLYARYDHEWGRGSAAQDTLGLGVEKFFYNSPVSLSLNAEAYRKSGEFEPKTSDQRVNLMLRYEIGGKGFRPLRETRQVRVEPQAAAPEPEPPQTGAGTLQATPRKPEMKMVKITASMSADAFFDFDSARITPRAKVSLDQVIAKLKEKGHTGNIHLVGHTCSIGPAAYNKRLSERRAHAIKDYLAAAGVAGDSFVVEGKGKLEPRYPNDTPANRAKNRRVDMEFVSYIDVAQEVPLPPEETVTPPAKPEAKKAAPPPVEWRTEYIETEPAWLRRALHNPVRHKQTVDVYRQEEKTTVVTNGARTFVNRPPVAADDGFQVAGNSSANLLDLLNNDSDPDGDAMRIEALTTPAHGTASISGKLVSYTPAAGYAGADSFSYTITDDKGGTATARVSITVAAGPVNRSPAALNDAYTVPGNSSNNALAVLTNDSDPDGDALRLVSVTAPAHGTASVSGGVVMYTPTPGYGGSDSFGYTISDDKGGSASATVTITVTPSSANRPPVAANDAFSVTGNSSANALDVLANDSDPDGDALRILPALAQAPAHGSASVSGNRILYTPAPGYRGTDSLVYTVTDDKGGTATASVSLTVNAPNTAPVAAADAFTVAGNSSNNLFDVLSNDSDADGDALRIVSTTAPAHGTATVSGGRVSYTPTAGYQGSDSFSYTVTDDKGGNASATVTITVTAPNRAPAAVNDVFSVAGNSSGNLLDVLANDSDPDGDTLRLVSVTAPAHGTATVSGNRVSYTPAAGYQGADTFSYTVTDDKGGSATATVTVSIGSPNRPPVAADDYAWVIWGKAVDIDVLANDSDPDRDTLTITSVGAVTTGSVSIVGGKVRYQSNPTFTGQVAFTYTIADGKGGTASATVNVTVIDP